MSQENEKQFVLKWKDKFYEKFGISNSGNFKSTLPKGYRLWDFILSFAKEYQKNYDRFDPR